MVIDYSKWDKMDFDTDSEAEDRPPSVPAPPAPTPTTPQLTTAPAAPGPSGATTSGETSTSRAGPSSTSEPPIPAVIIRCTKDKSHAPPWSATSLPATHPIFLYSSPQVPPIPTRIEVPLVFWRDAGIRRAARPGDLDNQIATYLHIDADSGFAPDAWQSGVGSVLAARADRKPLLPHHLEGVWMYCDRILDHFGDGVGPPTHLYSRAAFEKWWAKYAEEQKGFRPGRGGETDPDDWRAVPSPYEM